MPPAHAKEVLVALRHGMEQRAAQAHLFSGIEALLRTLHERGDTSAIASSDSAGLAQASLEPSLEWFSKRQFDIPLREKASHLQALSTDLSKGSKQCFVGDEIRDVKAAFEANIPFIGVSWGYNTV